MDFGTEVYSSRGGTVIDASKDLLARFVKSVVDDFQRVAADFQQSGNQKVDEMYREIQRREGVAAVMTERLQAAERKTQELMSAGGRALDEARRIENELRTQATSQFWEKESLKTELATHSSQYAQVLIEETEIAGSSCSW